MSNSLEILKERLAKGEIDQDEFDALKEKLDSVETDPAPGQQRVSAPGEGQKEPDNSLSNTLMTIGGIGVAFIVIAMFNFEQGTILNETGWVVLIISGLLFGFGLMKRK